jgi:hypothetical protein
MGLAGAWMAAGIGAATGHQLNRFPPSRIGLHPGIGMTLTRSLTSYTIADMRSSPPLWTLERFVLDSGESPVRAFLEALGGRDRIDALALLRLLAEQGNALKMPHSKPLGAGLFELRAGPVRLFYTFRPGRRIVLLDGLVKKRQEIPPGVLKRVRRYQRALETAERQRDGT